MVELSCIDIEKEVSLLLSHLILPHEGHMGAVLHIMACLGLYHISLLCMGPFYPDIDNEQFQEMDFLGKHQRTQSTKLPKSLGQTSRQMHVC